MNKMRAFGLTHTVYLKQLKDAANTWIDNPDDAAKQAYAIKQGERICNPRHGMGQHPWKRCRQCEDPSKCHGQSIKRRGSTAQGSAQSSSDPARRVASALRSERRLPQQTSSRFMERNRGDAVM